jgi:AraC-like DNA-binding protein
MIVMHYPAHPALKQLVSRIVLIRYELDSSKQRPVNPFPPQPEHCLYFYPHDRVTCRQYTDQTTSQLPRSIIVGPQLSRVDLTMGYNMLVVYIGFHPGGLHRLLGIPMNEIIDRHLDSTLLLGREIEDVTEQLHEANHFTQMIDVIEKYFLKKINSVKLRISIELVLEKMVQDKNQVNINELSRQACTSVRQLERQFKERVGIPPKLYTRLVRFSRAWNIREKDPTITWTSIAHTCGYADQMHMIRDFKEFVDVTPTSLQTDLEKSPLRLQADSMMDSK